MTDMLVKLYALPPLEPAIEAQRGKGIDVRRALPAEKYHLGLWVRENFSNFWASECDVSFAHQPVGCFIAVRDNAIIGFSCYDVVRRGMFGPLGVGEAARGQGTGAALLLACLHDMAIIGYAYGIIAGVGPVEFYEKAVGATVIPDSTPGVFRGLLRFPGEPDIDEHN